MNTGDFQVASIAKNETGVQVNILIAIDGQLLNIALIASPNCNTLTIFLDELLFNGGIIKITDKEIGIVRQASDPYTRILLSGNTALKGKILPMSANIDEIATLLALI